MGNRSAKKVREKWMKEFLQAVLIDVKRERVDIVPMHYNYPYPLTTAQQNVLQPVKAE